MKISIITATYNSGKTVRETIESVLAQKDINLEHVIIDGASTDNTLEIVNEYKDRISKIVSEKDGGIYEAMNKGIGLASGDIVGILNSDDVYHSDLVLSHVVHTFEAHPECDCVYGDISYFPLEGGDKVTRVWKAGVYKEKNMRNGWMPPHPGLFVRKRVYDECGTFRTEFRVAADYEFILRLLMKFHKKLFYLPEFFVRMRDGGTSAKKRSKTWKEVRNAWKVNGLKTPKFLITRRVLSKIPQLFMR